MRLNLQLFINLNPNKFSHQIHYHVFIVKLDRFFGRCNTLNYLSNKVCVPNKTEDVKIHIFDMITGINELKILTKYILYKCKCK